VDTTSLNLENATSARVSQYSNSFPLVPFWLKQRQNANSNSRVKRKTKQSQLNIHYKSYLFLKHLKMLLNINYETFMITVINIVPHGKNTRHRPDQIGNENRSLNIHNKFDKILFIKR
jgi:hypothetical protein